MIRMIKSFFSTFYTLFFQPDRFKVRLAISRRLEFLIYECPGKWASDEEIAELTNMLREVASAGQGGKEVPEYGCLTGEREDMKDRVISIAYDNKLKKAVGFSAQAYMDIHQANFKERVLHLGLIYVDPSYQGKSVTYLLAMFPNILILIKNGFRDIWVSNVTQVPAVYGLVCSNYYKVYPGKNENTKQGYYHRMLSRQIFENHKKVFGVGEDAGFDPNLQIITNSYTGGSDHLKKSYSESTKHRLLEVNKMCESHLDYDRGDDFVQLGLLSPKVFIELFKNKKSRQTRVQMAFNIMMFSVAALVLPVMRWFIPCDSQLQQRPKSLPLKI